MFFFHADEHGGLKRKAKVSVSPSLTPSSFYWMERNMMPTKDWGDSQQLQINHPQEEEEVPGNDQDGCRI